MILRIVPRSCILATYQCPLPYFFGTPVPPFISILCFESASWKFAFVVEPNPRYELTIASKGVISSQDCVFQTSLFLSLVASSVDSGAYMKKLPQSRLQRLYRCDLGASQLLQHSGGVARSQGGQNERLTALMNLRRSDCPDGFVDLA